MISHQRPPFYEKILAQGLMPNENTIYTYGYTIYNPSGRPLPYYLIIHEATHAIQQGNDPDKWWARYLIDSQFRVHQELEAYSMAYIHICRIIADRNEQSRLASQFASALAGPTYGNIIKFTDAYRVIRERGKIGA